MLRTVVSGVSMWRPYIQMDTRRNSNTPTLFRHAAYQGWMCALLLGVNAHERSAWSDATAAQIRAERAAAGWTQEQLAERSGVPRISIARIETGVRVADTSQVPRFCAAFGLSVTEFFRRVESRIEQL